MLAQQLGTQRVGEGVREPLAQDAVAGQRGVRLGRGRGAQLRRDVVVAARRREDQRGVPRERAGQGVVGRRVARVERQHHVGVAVELDVADRADHEVGVDAELVGDRGVVVGRLLLDVDARHPHRQALAEVGVGGEGEVGVAAPEVDDAQRVVGRRDPEATLLQGVVEAAGQQPEELLDLAVLGLAARLDPTAVVADPERDQHRRVLRQQPSLGTVVLAGHLHRSRTLGRVEQHGALLGDARLQRLADRLDVPVAEGLGQQRVDGGLGGRAERVVGGVRLRVVVGHDLQVRPGLEVHRPDLDAPDLPPVDLRRGSALAAPAGPRPHQAVGRQQRRPHPIQLLAHRTRLTGPRRGRR